MRVVNLRSPFPQDFARPSVRPRTSLSVLQSGLGIQCDPIRAHNLGSDRVLFSVAVSLAITLSYRSRTNGRLSRIGAQSRERVPLPTACTIGHCFAQNTTYGASAIS